MVKLNPTILKYLAERLGKSENTIRQKLSFLRRSYAGYSLNIIAHIYAMENGLSVMQKLSKEDKEEIKRSPIFIGGRAPSPKQSNPIKKKVPMVITPKTKFSNIKILWSIIRDAKEYFWWMDKHFSRKGLEPLSEEILPNRVKEIKILLGSKSTGIENLKAYFKLFKEEMISKGIKNVECRVISDEAILNSIHGRWIITKNKAYSVPPINSWFMGQYDEVKKTMNFPPFLGWWNSGKNILNL